MPGRDPTRSSAASGHEAPLPRVIWLLWLQGWDVAPELVRACAETWRRHNPGWTVRLLDRASLADVLPDMIPDGAFAALAGKTLEPEAMSDVIRIELLARYGGVWADATTYCLEPLDDWLAPRMTAGFFAFARPAADRMLSSWFLAAVQGSGIGQRWRAATWAYWATRTSRDHYFWFHRLFAECHAADPWFREAWDAVPTLSALGPHRFEPYEPRLAEPPTADDESFLAAPDVPVLKLTHKRPPPEAPAGSVARWLCDRAWAIRPRSADTSATPEVLVTWYGSFAGHGTIGDLLSLESVVARLVAEGWQVAHASATDVAIPGATRVQWDEVDPQRFAAVLFVCGPIIAGHLQTEALFRRYRDRPLCGVGVSLFGPGHPLHADPFTAVFARQGWAERYEDVALVAPLPVMPSRDRAGKELVIGLALRGPQDEYGTDNCLWAETEQLAREAAEQLLRSAGGRIETIENHLDRAGRSAAAIEASYADCDLVITSRFHGAMLAARHGVPFVALDQIRGGGKVAPLLAARGWPHVLRADRVTEAEIARSAAAALAAAALPGLQAFRDRAVSGANRTLAAMTSWLAGRATNRRSI